jgi:hypothetical protein
MTFARVRALILVGVLFVTAAVVVIMAIGRDSQTRPRVNADCPAGLVPANLTMPNADQIVLNVFNGTNKVGLAQDIGREFTNRGFTVKKTGNVRGEEVEDVAVIRYGPLAVGAAWYVSAYFLVGAADMQFDIEREGAEVDVIIGLQFRQLATVTEVNQSIAAITVAGDVQLPAGTCEIEAPPATPTPSPSPSPGTTPTPTAVAA